MEKVVYKPVQLKHNYHPANQNDVSIRHSTPINLSKTSQRCYSIIFSQEMKRNVVISGWTKRRGEMWDGRKNSCNYFCKYLGKSGKCAIIKSLPQCELIFAHLPELQTILESGVKEISCGTEISLIPFPFIYNLVQLSSSYFAHHYLMMILFFHC